MRPLLLAMIAALGASSGALGNDDVEAVKNAVLVPQEAGWVRHDLKAYMAQWAEDARMVLGRGERIGEFDTVIDRKQIEAVRRLHMHGKPAAGSKMTFENVNVTVKGDDADLRSRTTIVSGDDYERLDELYRLRRTAAGWKVVGNRAWPLKIKTKDRVRTFDARAWQTLDETAVELRRTDPRGDKAAEAFLAAWRFREAHDILKKVTARADAAAADWVLRGQAALDVGDAGDALSAFHRALELDANASVPQFARELKKKN